MLVKTTPHAAKYNSRFKYEAHLVAEKKQSTTRKYLSSYWNSVLTSAASLFNDCM
jgi:hypothetical protein